MVTDAEVGSGEPDSSKWNIGEHGRVNTDVGPSHGHGESHTGEAGKLALDWITLWQSELSAMAVDREIQQAWQTMIALWAGVISATLRSSAIYPDFTRHDSSSGRAASNDAPRSPPFAAAPDARDAEIDQLARHIAALEGRLAQLERRGDPPMGGKKPTRRKPRS